MNEESQTTVTKRRRERRLPHRDREFERDED